MGNPTVFRYLLLRWSVLCAMLLFLPLTLHAQTELEQTFTRLDSLFKASNYSPEVLEAGQNALRTTSKKSPEHALLLYHIGLTHRALLHYQDALDCLQQSKTVIDQHPTASAEVRFHIYHQLTDLHEESGNIYAAMDASLEELRLISETIDRLNQQFDATKERAQLLLIADQIERWGWRLTYCMISLSTNQSLYAEDTLKDFPDFKKETKSIFGVQSIEYAQAELFEGQLYEQTFDYQKARQAYIRSATRYGIVAGKSSTQYAKALFHWGMLESKLGDFQSARRALQLALRILDEQRQHTPAYAEILESLALFNAYEGRFDEATRQLQEAYDIYVKLFREDSPLVFHTRMQMADVFLAQGNYTAAEQLFAYLNEHFDSMNPYDISTSFQKEASLHIRRKEFPIAIQFLEGAQEIFDSGQGTFNENKEQLLQHHNNLAYCYFRTNQYDKSETHYQQFLAINRQFAHDLFLFLSEQERAAYWTHQSPILEQMLLINHTPEGSHDTDFSHAMAKHWQARSSLLYDAALFQKGILLEASRNILAAIEQSDDAELKAKLSRQRSIRQQLARLTSAQISAPHLAEQVRELQREAIQLERALMAGSRQYADFMNYLNVTWKEVHQQLGEQDVAIEFVTSVDGERTYYSAELLRKEFEQPLHISLFSLPNGQPLHLDLHFVDHFLWPKLLPHLRENDRIYFSPSGDLHKIGIEYLFIARDTRACDRFEIHRLSSTRQLALQPNRSEQRSAVLYGGLDFNLGTEEMAYYAAIGPTRGKALHADLSLNHQRTLWGFLPGTEQEVRSIHPLLQQHDYQTKLYMGAEGVEESFKGLSGGANSLIHIATHGYFLPEESAKEPAQFGFLSGLQTTTEETSLLRAGLLFSGANNAWLGGAPLPNEVEDGILTAKEIAALDLQGADLVVLSACQTGLGEVTGEGVFGLQRAFKKAGVQSLLMTLWEVDDLATQQMMIAFYRHLTAGKSKHEALKAAQQELHTMTFTDAEGRARSGSDPHYWAAFILLD